MLEERKKGGVILVAKSVEFGRMVKDIVGSRSLRKVASWIEVSPAYMGQIVDGHVPNDEIIGRLAARFELDTAATQRLFAAASEIRSDIDPESLIQVACEAVGMSTSRRLAVLESFRAARMAQISEKSAA